MKLIRRRLSISVACIMIFMMLLPITMWATAQQIRADNGIEVAISYVDDEEFLSQVDGADVAIMLFYTGTEIGAIKGELGYDTASASFLEADGCTGSSTNAWSVNDQYGCIRYAWVDAASTAQDSPIMTFFFSLNEGATETSFSLYADDMEAYIASGTGEITIVSVPITANVDMLTYQKPAYAIQIISQPVHFIGDVGDRASFSVDAVGNDLNYQWQFCRNNSDTWSNSGLSTANNSTLSFTASAAYNGMKFRCVVTDGSGNEAISDEASVTLFVGPKIVEQPVSCEQAKGKKVAFTVVATGDDLSYQWQFLKAGNTNWSNSGLSSAKTSTLSFTMSSGYDGLPFRCVVTDAAGNEAISNEVTATLLAGPIITVQPEPCEQSKGQKAQFTVAATGDGLTYKWQYLRAGSTNWANSGLSSAKSSTLTFTMSSGYDGMQFRCVITDENGISATSEPAMATLKAGPAIITDPVSVEQALGTTVNLNVNASGEDLAYKWQYLRKGYTTWKNSSALGAASESISFKMAAGHDGMQFRCIVTDANGNSATSGSALITVLPGPGIVTQPQSVDAALSTPVTLNVVATGSDLTYQWQYQRKGRTTWGNSGLSSAKSSTLTFKMGTGYDGMKFRCVVTDSNGYSVTSDAALITALEGPGIITQPESVNASNGTAVKITTLAVGTDVTYCWQYQRATSTSWSNSNLSSAKSAALTFKMASGYDGMKFRCKVTDADGKTTYTDTALITMVSGPAITKQPEDETVAIGTKATFSITASGDGLTYQWQYQKAGKMTWTNSSSSGNKSNTLKVSGTTGTNGMKFRCVVTNSEGLVSISNYAVLTAK